VKATGGDDIAWSIASKITCPDKTVAKREFWNRLREELFAAEWDLLLCSAGSLSAVICEMARQHGRMAIDVGSIDQNQSQHRIC
jgi:type IV secretory pathway TraG/TraD family ATPase VirD4